MKGVSILGSTGSIGVSTLDVVGAFPEHFRVVALAAGRRIERLAEQVNTFLPKLVSVAEPTDIPKLKEALTPAARDGLDILAGHDGAQAVASHSKGSIVVTAMVGAVGLSPTLAAIRRGATVAIANKEPLVMAGKLCQELAEAHNARLLPVDSEHSAIYQCLNGESHDQVSKLILTCSGGPFRQAPSDLSTVTVDQALAHPTWSMGPKITIDSATLMNKGLEVVEAHWLFGIPAEQIEILIHPQSVIHSMVEYTDGAVIAQLGTPDMRGPIGYALGHPLRLPLDVARIDWTSLGQLTFEAPDYERFRSPRLAYESLKAGGTAPTVLNAANEVAVAAFLAHRIRYIDIIPFVEEALSEHKLTAADTLDNIVQADAWAREYTDDKIASDRPPR